MADYSLEFTPIFEHDLVEIAEDTQRWGYDATAHYLNALYAAAETFRTFPYRYAVYDGAGERRYRSINIKAHKIFYEIDETCAVVRLVRCVRANRNLPELLKQ